MYRMLDLFCGAGGCAYGYRQAGFFVVGVDHKPQPRYAGDVFIRGDALDYARNHCHEYDVVHASPPCQHYSHITAMPYRYNHPDLIADIRAILRAADRLYVIENVENARHHLLNPIKLCGTMFGLGVYRHRYFEIGPDVFWWLTPTCNHSKPCVLLTGTTSRRNERGRPIEYNVQQCRSASGIDWMTRRELDEAVPPAYTEWIGRKLLSVIGCYDSRPTTEMA